MLLDKLEKIIDTHLERVISDEWGDSVIAFQSNNSKLVEWKLKIALIRAIQKLALK